MLFLFGTGDQRVSQTQDAATAKKQQGDSFGSYMHVSICKGKINLAITCFLSREMLVIAIAIKRPQNSVYFGNLGLPSRRHEQHICPNIGLTWSCVF